MTRGFRLCSKAKYKTRPYVPDNNRKGDLPPQQRADREFVTIANCSARECRWPYGEPSPHMTLCGRPVADGKPYCADHQARVSAKAQHAR